MAAAGPEAKYGIGNWTSVTPAFKSGGIDINVASTSGRPRSSNRGASSQRTRRFMASRPRSAAAERRRAIPSATTSGSAPITGIHPSPWATIRATFRPCSEPAKSTGSRSWRGSGRQLSETKLAVSDVKVASRSFPKRATHSDHVVEYRTSPSEVNAACRVLVGVPTHADTEFDAPAREHVDRGDGLRQRRWRTQWRDQNSRREADAIGDHCNRGQDGERIKERRGRWQRERAERVATRIRSESDVIRDRHGVDAQRLGFHCQVEQGAWTTSGSRSASWKGEREARRGHVHE